MSVKNLVGCLVFALTFVSACGGSSDGGSGEPAASASTDTGARQGRMIVTADWDGDKEIYSMNADGTDVQQLTSNDVNDLALSVSQGAASIVFYRSGPNGPTRLFTLDLAGSDEQLLLEPLHEFGDAAAAFSPDGNLLSVARNSDDGPEIYRVGADGSNVERLTDSDGRNWSPSWSPDGELIAFQSDRNEDGFQVFVMKADGSDPQQVTDEVDGAIGPRWSPDGSRILYLIPTADEHKLAVIAPDGEDREVIHVADRRLAWLDWSSSGDEIVFSLESDDDPDSDELQSFTMDRDGSNVEPLTDAAGRDIRYAIWLDDA